MKSVVLICLVFCFSATAVAQEARDVAGKHIDLYFFLKKLLGKKSSFSADVENTTYDANGRVASVSSQRIALTKGKLRTELVTTTNTLPGLSDAVLAGMKRMGIHKHVWILRVDQKLLIYLLPEAHLHRVEPFLFERIYAAEKGAINSWIKKRMEGAETIEGIACRKYRLIPPKRDSKVEGFVWLAPSLDDFPVKFDFTANGKRSVQIYRNVVRAEPDPNLFTIPANSVRKGTVEGMIATANENWVNRLINESKARK